MKLDEETAARFVRIALSHVTREYPNKLDHVLNGPGDAATPRALHPIFYGSFDWHSCVHGYWMLARLLRRFPAMAPAAEIAALFDAALTADNIAGELAYLSRPLSGGFERPYGWAWLLKLAAELDDTRWTIAPLADALAARFKSYLPKLTFPVRAGTHANTAFALMLAADYAQGHDPDLLALLAARALDWFGHDTGAQAWEPSGEDFLSPLLCEAVAMHQLLPPARFAGWMAAFLPGLHHGKPPTLFHPAQVSDRSDGRLAHLDGVNLSRAWCFRLLAQALPQARARLEDAAARHLAASLPHVAGDYMGEHWLATYAVLATDGA